MFLTLPPLIVFLNMFRNSFEFFTNLLVIVLIVLIIFVLAVFLHKETTHAQVYSPFSIYVSGYPFDLTTTTIANARYVMFVDSYVPENSRLKIKSFSLLEDYSLISLRIPLSIWDPTGYYQSNNDCSNFLNSDGYHFSIYNETVNDYLVYNFDSCRVVSYLGVPPISSDSKVYLFEFSLNNPVHLQGGHVYSLSYPSGGLGNPGPAFILFYPFGSPSPWPFFWSPGYGNPPNYNFLNNLENYYTVYFQLLGYSYGSEFVSGVSLSYPYDSLALRDDQFNYWNVQGSFANDPPQGFYCPSGNTYGIAQVFYSASPITIGEDGLPYSSSSIYSDWSYFSPSDCDFSLQIRKRAIYFYPGNWYAIANVIYPRVNPNSSVWSNQVSFTILPSFSSSYYFPSTSTGIVPYSTTTHFIFPSVQSIIGQSPTSSFFDAPGDHLIYALKYALLSFVLPTQSMVDAFQRNLESLVGNLKSKFPFYYFYVIYDIVKDIFQNSNPSDFVITVPFMGHDIVILSSTSTPFIATARSILSALIPFMVVWVVLSAI